MNSPVSSILLRRPILLGGLGLTCGALMLNGLDAGLSHWGGTIVWGAITLGSGLWWLQQRTAKSAIDRLQLPTTPVDRALVDKTLAAVEQRINQLVAERGDSGEIHPSITEFRDQLNSLRQNLDDPIGGTAKLRQQLSISFLGGRSVGKTTLSQIFRRGDTVEQSQETSESTDMSLPHTEDVTAADLVLFLTTGDVTDSEFQTIRTLLAQRHRVLLVFNKQDQYLPDDRPVILQQLRDRVAGVLAAEDVIAVSAKPAPIKVRRIEADGSMQEQLEQPEPEVAALQARIQQILTSEKQQLVYATVVRQAQALQRSIQAELNKLRRDRALPVIEQYQWIAAAATFANPVSSLDLLATATINAQMVMDLGAIYQQKFSLEQAKTMTGTLASQMVKLGLVEVASQAISPLLKTHALTYVAGGMLQGVSAAYLTRVAGLSLTEYFEEQSYLPQAESNFQPDRLMQKLQSVFQANQRSAFLQTLVKQAIGRLTPPAAAAAS